MTGNTYKITGSFDEKSYGNTLATRAVTYNLSQKSRVCVKRMLQSYHSRQKHTNMTGMMFVKNPCKINRLITSDHNFSHRSLKTLLQDTHRTGFYTVNTSISSRDGHFIHSLHSATPEKLGTTEMMRLLSIPYKNRKLNRLVIDEVNLSSPSVYSAG